jgi:hypothetical protein
LILCSAGVLLAPWRFNSADPNRCDESQEDHDHAHVKC